MSTDIPTNEDIRDFEENLLQKTCWLEKAMYVAGIALILSLVWWLWM